MNSIEVVPYSTETNIEELYKIHLSVMPNNDQMTKQNFYDEFVAPNRQYFIAKCGDKIVGFVGLFECDSDYNIIGIAVDKPFQHHKVGTMLLDCAKNFATTKNKKSLSLEVDEENIIAQNFYKKNGFVVTNVRKKYYKDNDAYVMFCYL